MNDQLEPDLDDTVETLIAKGFTRVKATKLFYENQKIKAQQKHDQPLYHVDSHLQRESSKSHPATHFTVETTMKDIDVPLSYSPSPRPSFGNKTLPSFPFTDDPSKMKPMNSSSAVDIVTAPTSDVYGEGIAMNGTDVAVRNPESRSSRVMVTGTAHDSPIHAHTTATTHSTILSRTGSSSKLGDSRLLVEENAAVAAPPIAAVSTIRLPSAWTADDEEQVSRLVEQMQRGDIGGGGSGSLRERALREYIKMQNERYAQKMTSAIVTEFEKPAAVTTTTTTTCSALPANQAGTASRDRQQAALDLDPISEAEVERLVKSGAMSREAAIEQVLMQAFHQKGRTNLLPSGKRMQKIDSSNFSVVSSEQGGEQIHHSNSDEDSFNYSVGQNTLLPVRLPYRHPGAGAAPHPPVVLRAAAKAEAETLRRSDSMSSFGGSSRSSSPAAATARAVEERRVADEEAFRHQLIQQQRELYGVDMMSTLVEEDDATLDQFVQAGCSQSAALLNIFQRKVADGVILSLKSRRAIDHQQQHAPPTIPTLPLSLSGAAAAGGREPYRGGASSSVNGGPAMQMPPFVAVPASERLPGTAPYSRLPFAQQQQYPLSEPGTPTTMSPRSQPDMNGEYQQQQVYNGGHGYEYDARIQQQQQRGIASSEQEEEMELDMLMSRGFTRAEAIRMFLASKQQQRAPPPSHNGYDFYTEPGPAAVGYDNRGIPAVAPASSAIDHMAGAQHQQPLYQPGMQQQYAPQPYPPQPPYVEAGWDPSTQQQQHSAVLRPGLARSSPSARRVSYRWQAADEAEVQTLVGRGYSREAAQDFVGRRIAADLQTGQLPMSTAVDESAGGGSGGGGGGRFGGAPPGHTNSSVPAAAAASVAGSARGRLPPPHTLQRDLSRSSISSDAASATGSAVAPTGVSRPPARLLEKTKSQEDMELAIMLSEQESLYHTTMLDTARPGDEDILRTYMADGRTTRNRAMQMLFEERMGLRPSGVQIPGSVAVGSTSLQRPALSSSSSQKSSRDFASASVPPQGESPRLQHRPVLQSQPSSREYTPPSLQSQPSSRQYTPPSLQSQPSSRQFTPPPLQPQPSTRSGSDAAKRAEGDAFKPGVLRVPGVGASSSSSSSGSGAPGAAASSRSAASNTAAAASRSSNGPPPNDKDVAALCSMGFSRSAVLDALSRYGNSVDRAAEYLIGNG